MKELAVQIGYLLITVFGMAICVQVVGYVHKKIDLFQTSVTMKKKDKLNAMIDQVQSVIDFAVITVSQTYVTSLKNAGTFDQNSAITAKRKALDICENIITKDGVEAIEILYGDFATWLEGKIEESVQQNKTLESK